MSSDQPPGGEEPKQPKRTVRATRRRPAQAPGAGSRERADAPQREQPDQPAAEAQQQSYAQPPPQQPYGQAPQQPYGQAPQQPYVQQPGGAVPPRPPQPSALGGGRGGMRNLILIGIVVLLVIFVGPNLLGGLGGTAPEARSSLKSSRSRQPRSRSPPLGHQPARKLGPALVRRPPRPAPAATAG